ncbi:30S ribosomal protein S13 [Paenibacillus sp. MAHUQ-46]|uniref:30S ribosomal protein S13 n=1 Tax=Paenibacillus roseus TaxID=2798579 RepID=A0A934J7F0_9BACL|nr:ribosomal protein uS13 [Paenibacillus roseus]MBJ6361777.1 30S ribosomal protein S13 [Paenibacillus roseus]
MFLHYTNLNEKKQLVFALTNIFGIHKHHALQICDILGVCPTTRLGDLPGAKITSLSQLLSFNYEKGIDVKRYRLQDIQLLIDIGSYRGIRHTLGLPVRGQRTHRNAHTARRMNKKRNNIV